MRTSASLGVELNGKRGRVGITNALAGTVVAVDVRNRADFFRNAVADNRVTVVLLGDERSVHRQILNGLISAAVTVFQLFGFRAVCKRKQLMSQTNSESRYLRGNKFTQSLN